MNRIQSYLFSEVLRSVLIIVGGLALLAILAQGLSQTDLIVENRQNALTYFYVIALGAPQIIALLTPMAIFVAGIWALNRLHRDSEIIVGEAAGLTRWQIASPIMRLAVIAAIGHLAINLWVQPTAQREMRETVQDARADLLASLIRPGQFNSAGDDLTVFARESRGGELLGIVISDARDPDGVVDYLAQRGGLVEVDGTPAIVMRNGQIHQMDQNDALNVLNFEQYTFDLTPFMQEQSGVVLKASDRYLHELFSIDRTNYQEVQDEEKFYAEGHARLTTPLLSIAMGMLAVIAVLGGDFSRRGYAQRISIAAGGAVGIIVVQLGVQSASADDRALNALQWVLPILVTIAIGWIFFRGGRKFRRRKQVAAGGAA